MVVCPSWEDPGETGDKKYFKIDPDTFSEQVPMRQRDFA